MEKLWTEIPSGYLWKEVMVQAFRITLSGAIFLWVLCDIAYASVAGERDTAIRKLEGDWEFCQHKEKEFEKKECGNLRWTFERKGYSIIVHEWDKHSGRKSATRLYPKIFRAEDGEIFLVLPRDVGFNNQEEFLLRFDSKDSLLGISEYRGDIRGRRPGTIETKVELKRLPAEEEAPEPTEVP